jgi:hypothetical protein
MATRQLAAFGDIIESPVAMAPLRRASAFATVMILVVPLFAPLGLATPPRRNRMPAVFSLRDTGAGKGFAGMLLINVNCSGSMNLGFAFSIGVPGLLEDRQECFGLGAGVSRCNGHDGGPVGDRKNVQS